jgi:hypothetical protein
MNTSRPVAILSAAAVAFSAFLATAVGTARTASAREEGAWSADPAGADEFAADQPLAEEAERTAEAIRKAVVAGVKKGRHETIHIGFGGGSKRGKVTGATAAGIQVTLPQVTLPLAWTKVDPRRLYFLGRKYLLAPAAPSEGTDGFRGHRPQWGLDSARAGAMMRPC